jgi:predicted Zn-dependent protease
MFMRKRRVYSLGSAIILVLTLAACATAPITGRRQLNLIGEGQVMQLGMSEFQKIKETTPVSRDPELNALVQKVGKKIAAAANEDLPNAQWEFVVFDSDQANAFCLPGGKVGVYKGILPITRDEAGLATVIGHEVAHASARHGAERMSQAMAAQTGGQLLGVGLSGADPRIQSLFQLAYPIGAQLGVLLPYGRKQESEADRIGLHYMARAGYNPEAAVGFWERFSAYNQGRGGKGGPAFLRTHPVDEVRIKQIQEWLPEAQAEFRTDIISTPAR